MKAIRVLHLIQYHRKLDRAFRRGFPMTPEGVALYCEDAKRRWRARAGDRRTQYVRKEHAELVAAADRIRGVAPITPAQAMLLAGTRTGAQIDLEIQETRRQSAMLLACIRRDRQGQLMFDFDSFLSVYGGRG